MCVCALNKASDWEAKRWPKDGRLHLACVCLCLCACVCVGKCFHSLFAMTTDMQGLTEKVER